MPLREDLLNPIAGTNPAGTSLRYDRVYDQIKDARTEEDDSLPAGGWSRQTKKADFRLAAKLAGDALAVRSKDLQLAVWLGEALIKLEGAALLAPVLQLFLHLQQDFWDTLHPEIDEGDAGMRAAPLQWAATRYTKLLNEVGLTRKGVGILEYKAARALGTEEEASRNDAKRKAREEAVAAGKLTSEDVTDAIAATPKSFYVALEQQVTDALNVLNELDIFCEEKYGDDSPSYRTLRTALEEVQNLVGSLLREKRKLDPDPVVVAPIIEAPVVEEEPVEFLPESEPIPVAVQQPVFEVQAPAVEEAPAARVATAPARVKPGSQSATPENWEDALARIAGAVSYLTAQKPESALPFLISSAVRMAELYQLVVDSRLDSIPAPPTELRQRLKRAASDREWREVHTTATTALASPCGSGWLDLYRYLWVSCDELGWYTQRNAVSSAVKQRLRDLPQLPSLTLNDDTPSANAETLRWIQEEIAPPPAPPPPEPEIEEVKAPVPMLESVLLQEREREESPEIEDLFTTARGLAAHGQIQGAIQLLARDAAHQSVGRLRFNRNLQIAELCLESGNSAVAVPVLQGLVREVEERKLESWEPPSSAAKPYALLLQCANVAKLDTQSIFARLCAIDPSAALSMAPPIEN